MTDRELNRAHLRRREIWRTAPSEQCPESAALMAERRDLEAAIVRELAARTRPAPLPGGGRLWLAAERDWYFEADATGRPVHYSPGTAAGDHEGRSFGHDYAAARQGVA